MNWTVIGINYQKANLAQRQRYALNEDQLDHTYALLRSNGIEHALAISTCNRTEFFIPSEKKEEAVDLITEEIYKGDVERDLFHCKKEAQATDYFFRICSGLESQISGDFEILGQVRKASSRAKKAGMLSGTWERTINNALSAAKKARTHTGYYSGASSTSYAAIEYLKNCNIDLKKLKYLILGAGKIGGHTIDHLLKRVPAENISLANRTYEKAESLARKKGLGLHLFEDVKDVARDYDVIICATNAPEFILTREDFPGERERYIIDLSVPLNVDPAVAKLQGLKLMNVDELSKIVNQNMEKREAEKASVERIVEESIQDLNAWFTIKSGMPMLSELKGELRQLKREALSNVATSDKSHSEAFLDEYTDELFDQLSQQWIKKVRNMAANAG